MKFFTIILVFLYGVYVQAFDLINAIKNKTASTAQIISAIESGEMEQEVLDDALYDTVMMKDVDHDIVSALLSAGADPNVSRSDISVLLRAVINEDVETASRLLSTNKVDVNFINSGYPTMDDWYPVSSLHVAAQKGNAELISLLISAGADPNLDMHYKTPLDVAVENLRWKAIDLLLDEEACLSDDSHTFARAIRKVLRKTDSDQQGKDIEKIFSLLGLLYEEELSISHDNSPDVNLNMNSIDRLVWMLSHIHIYHEHKKEEVILAIAFNDLNVFRMLLQNVSQIDAGALWMGISKHRPSSIRKDMWKVMLDNKMVTDVNLYKDNRGRTALQIELFLWSSQVSNDVSGLEMLLANGADPNMRVNGHPPLLNYGNLPFEVTRILIKYGAAPRDWDKYLSYQKDLERKQSMLPLFVSAGALNARDALGRTLLHVLVTEEHKNLHFMIPELIQKGANPNIPDHEGKTAMDAVSSPKLKDLMLEHAEVSDETDNLEQSCQRKFSKP